MNYKGLGYLQNKLTSKQPRVALRYGFYEMKNLTFDFGISTPPDLRYWNACVGWCAKAVDTLADRLEFRRMKNDVFNMNQIFDLNNRDTLFDSAFLGALITSCDFIYISEDESGFPRLQVIDGYNATGVIDPITGLLTEGYAVLERDAVGLPTREAYFTFEWTAYYEGGQLVDVRENKAPYPLLVPVVFRPDAKRPFGHSRISRACMSLTGSALRTIKRSEISAEFYSFPQKWATGVDPSATDDFDKWSAAMSAMMRFTLNEDGTDHVKLGQFSQQSMAPHIEQLKMFASAFAGETGLTLDDLGFPSSTNPSSAEAIKTTHENLRLTARKAQKTFGTGLVNAGYLAACVRDNYKYQRQQIYVTEPQWYPVFGADVTMLGAIGDGIAKINQSIPNYVDEDMIFELTGL
jgi:hypothetical protein